MASGVLNTAAQLGTALGVAAVLLVTALLGGAPAGWAGAGSPAPPVPPVPAWFARSGSEVLGSDVLGPDADCQ